MGADALRGNGITLKLLYLLRDKSLTPSDEPLHKVRKSRLILFLAIQLMGFGVTFAITQTIGTSFLGRGFLVPWWPSPSLRKFSDAETRLAAIGFPVVILLLVPLRTLVVPRLPFTPEELSILDGPTASPFVSLLVFARPLFNLALAMMALCRRWHLLAVRNDTLTDTYAK